MSILAEVESKKAKEAIILKNYTFLAAHEPVNCWFTPAERDARTALILEQQDLAKLDPAVGLDDRLLKQLDRALWRLGLNQFRDMKAAGKARLIRQALSYDRPKRGRPKGGAPG